ncbi:adenylate cyclase [Skermanella stibiiresistens SB22]|uniref:Adenylate cyclase n=1 Tax=Skermanella stibiiresistens SB22 TaxID=1385369 RepID=W9GQD8_9PROT|nr:adenylate/guanylate cyclase domain-containing protein [Skermanella stibiiresistens]EWY36004.1 adenylate cyclase [Skermanella stibiiresistens SB22]
MRRKLAAIMAGDVVGYSRMMADDEAGTYRELRAMFHEILGPIVDAHDGRIFKEIGDGFLATFTSVHEALDAAAVIQQTLQTSRLQLRIGLHLGDVIEEDGDTFGDGVNIAARLETMAEPGSIYVSDSVFRCAEKTAGRSFRRIGHRAAKNMPNGLEVYAVTIESTPSAVAHARTAKSSGWRRLATAGWMILAGTAVAVMAAAVGSFAPARQWIADFPAFRSSPTDSRPSVAVMPFDNMSGDPAQSYFTDGLSEDLITELSRNPELAVIARNSTFALRERAADIRHVGKSLRARYVVEGSARRQGDQLRVAAQLIDAETGTHLWAKTYDRRLEDVFAVQTELTAEIVASLVSYVGRSEIASVMRRPTDNLRAYDLVLRAREAHAHADANPASVLDARDLLRQALVLDPQYAAAHAYFGLNLIVDQVVGVTGTATKLDIATGIAAAREAIRLQPDLALAYRVLAFGLSASRDYPAGLQAAERAVALNPNDPENLAMLAKAQLRASSYQQAADNAERARLLHPMAPNYYAFIQAQALYAADRLDDAAAALGDCLINGDQRGNCLRIAVAVDVRRGRLDTARQAMARLKAAEPDFTLARELETERYGMTPMMTRYIADLGKADTPSAATADGTPRPNAT